MPTISPFIHGLIVAAGVGKRFGSDLPKQYTKIHNKTVLQHSVTALAQAGMTSCHLVIADQDPLAKTLDFDLPIHWVIGGQERMDSVLNGVEAIYHGLKPDTMCNQWVLIHDAARPCVLPQDIHCLLEQTTQHPTGKIAGGLLAVPVRDTIKFAITQNTATMSEKTLDRNQLWLAQTPQLFPLLPLYQYLHQATEQQIAFTDEASLFEHFGHTPLLVEGHHSNIKLTFPEDLLMAQALLT